MENKNGDNTNSLGDDLKEKESDINETAKIAKEAAAGSKVKAGVDAAKMIGKKAEKKAKEWITDPAKALTKKLKKKLIAYAIPIIAVILIPLLFFGTIFEVARIIKEKLVEIKDKILSWIGKWTTGDGIVVDDDDVDEFLEDLSAQGIDLADLGFMADEEDVEDDEDYKSIDNDETLNEKEKKEKKAKKKARKYIKRYMEASLVTQTAWTKNNGIKGIPGGIKLERHDAENDDIDYMTYVEEMSDLENYDEYTLDSEGKIVFLGRDGTTKTIDTSLYEQYELPIMFFIDLCLATQNPRYVYAIADYIIEGASASKEIADYSTKSNSQNGAINETGNYDEDGFTQKVELNGIQYTEYKQNSSRWANASYWGDTIGNSGCGPTSIAVVLSGFSQTASVTPVDVAGGMSQTGSGTISTRLNDYGISNTTYTSNYESKLRSYLESGKPLICSFDSTTLSDGSHFTSASHISAALGINGDQVYISNVYNSTNMRTGWVPISDVVKALTYLIGIDSTPDNRASGSTGITSLDGFLFLGDSRIEGIETQLENLGNDITAIGVGNSNPANWVNVTANGSGSVARGTYSNGSRNVQLPDSVNGICIMLGTNGLGQTSSMEQVLNNLHARYPNVTIYVDSIYHVGTRYWTGNPISFNNLVDTFNEWLQEFCMNNSWAKYVDISEGLDDDNGLLKTEYASDGLHLSSTEGINQLIENIQGGVTGDSSSIISGIIGDAFRKNWMTIRILDSCTVTTKTTISWYIDEETGEELSRVSGPTVTKDYTTTYYLVNVEHLFFRLSQTYDRTENIGEATTSSGHYNGSANFTRWETTTQVSTYGFTSPTEQDPVIKCEDTDAFVRLSKVKFKVPYSGEKIRAYDSFKDGGEMMFALMENNLDNELLVQIIKYVLYKMTGVDFGVTELETDIFNMSSYSPASSGRYATVTEMIKLMEGTTTVSADGTQYKVENIGDGQRTAGPGVTLGNNASRFAEYGIDVSQYGVGTWIDKTIVDAVAMDCIADVAEQVNALGLDLENWQVDALVSRTYNCGAYGKTGLQAFKRAYNTYGDTEALYNNFMSTPVTDAYGTYYPGLTRRRKAEWKLFHEGIYEWGDWSVDSKDVDYEGNAGISTQEEADALTETYNEMLNTVVHNGNSYMQSGPFPKYWSYSYNALTPFQCTWWANGRASMYLEQYGTKYKKYPTQMGNGGEYYRINASNGWFKYGSTPKVNSIISWAGNPYGHVAYVEGVTNNEIWISDAGSGVTWRGVRSITLSYAASSNGYIYLDEPQ